MEWNRGHGSGFVDHSPGEGGFVDHAPGDGGFVDLDPGKGGPSHPPHFVGGLVLQLGES